ncbi:5379_t:CDS:1, partial [Racocetra persica]
PVLHVRGSRWYGMVDCIGLCARADLNVQLREIDMPFEQFTKPIDTG